MAERNIHVRSPEEMLHLGCELGTALQPGQVIALCGELGAGKTLFVRGLAQGLVVPADVRITSPTFTLINQYHEGRLPLVHVDLYRLERDEEVLQLGLEDMLHSDVVCAVEWFDKFPRFIPSDVLEVRLVITSPTERQLHVRAFGTQSQALVGAILSFSARSTL